jgi:hypothetical protein
MKYITIGISIVALIICIQGILISCQDNEVPKHPPKLTENELSAKHEEWMSWHRELSHDFDSLHDNGIPASWSMK